MKPRHIWSVFALCLLVVLTGMGWLSVRAVQLDRAEVSARREAVRARRNEDLQRRVATALWRMDWIMAPIIAQEVTRPSYAYQAFVKHPLPAGVDQKSLGRVSPLLTRPTGLVVLNFDLTGDDQWTSPQIPAPSDVSAAFEAGLAPETLVESQRHLDALRGGIRYDQLLELVPDSLLPPPREATEADTLGDAAAVELQTAFFDDFARPRSPPLPSPTATGGQTVQVPPTTLPSALPQQRSGSASPEAFHRRGERGDQADDPREWERRNTGVQNMVRYQRAQLMSNNALLLPDFDAAREGVSRPLWIDSKLLLARRVVTDGQVRIQGSWLDWPAIRDLLKGEVSDLFPHIELLPVTSDSPVAPDRRMATLPVQLSVPDASLPDPSADDETSAGRFSTIQISLFIAWCCLALASGAIATMLQGVLKLSERRAAFVSAVTHELRSPLTTFRMYAEMLAEGMIRDDQQRAVYFDTLRLEADRLAHLVDNVLQYARLERRGTSRRRVVVHLAELIRLATQRLAQRANQSDMEIQQTVPPHGDGKSALTDPAAVEQILFNLVDNACKYASSARDRRIHVVWSWDRRRVRVRVSDHGPGIPAADRAKLFRPFCKSDREAAQSAPGIGLGLALCHRLASDLQGRLGYEASAGPGASFVLEIPLVDGAT
jgi:signal transduction histidine kinase